jgi:hypothetical protein
MSGDRWVIDSVKPRYSNLGTKRNAAMARAIERWPDIEAFAVWDDDDIYLPHHLEACVAVLGDHPWAKPSQILVNAGGHFNRMWTFPENSSAYAGYHGAWCFLRDAFEYIGGYAAMNSGEDMEIEERAYTKFWAPADPISPEFPDPTYCYTTSGAHLSAMGPRGYEKLGRQKIEPVTELDISWPEDYSKWPIDDEVLPRNW